MPGDSHDRGAGRLERWAAEARAAEAGGERSRQRWLRQQAAEEARFAAVLEDLAERGEPVVVTTVWGTVRPGALTAVGIDFVAVADATGQLTLVAMSAVAEVRPVSKAHVPAPGPRPAAEAPAGPTLGEVLASAAGDGPRVSLRCGQMVVSGELRAASAEVLTVALSGSPEDLAYVTLASLSEVSFLGSAG